MAAAQGSAAHMRTAGEVREFANRATGSAMELHESCMEAFQGLKLRRRHRYVIFEIQGDFVTVAATGARDAPFEEFAEQLPNAFCRYAVYDHEFRTADGRATSKLAFVTWLPHNATPYDKMGYSHGKNVLRLQCDGTFDVNAATIRDVEIGIGVREEEEEEESESDFDD